MTDGVVAMSRPTIFLLHALGMSGREWHRVVAALSDGYDCVALDLPGVGAAAADARTGVDEMADRLADAVRSCDPVAWMLVGHSMGGKIASIVAARAQAGEQGLSGLAGVVLLAASPPAPEPMDEDRRAEMIGWFADGAPSEADAETFLQANTAGPIDPADRQQAIDDLRTCGRHAWFAWLERGSREDWTGFVGTLAIPALTLAGAEDGDLGEEAQRRLNMPHYPHASVEVVESAAHLLPYERPAVVADAIARHWATVRDRVLPSAFARTLASPRVSRRTRAAMLARIGVPGDRFLSEEQRTTLAAIVARVLPGVAGDIALRIEAAVAQGTSDGWRFADVPPDAQAYEQGLSALAGFATLSVEEQDVRLAALAEGGVDGRAMSRWFEDLRAAAVRAWLAQPTGMARIGWDGFATGGDGRRLQGFVRTAADDAEPWQPGAAA